MNVAIPTLLSSKHFKISSVNFNRACSVLAPDLKPKCEDDNNYIICGEIGIESTMKNFFINFTDNWQDGYWPVVCNVQFIFTFKYRQNFSFIE